MTRKNHPRVSKCKENKNDKKTTIVQGLEGRLSTFVSNFKSVFSLQNSSAGLVSEKYLNGLFVSEKKNCDNISQKVDRHPQSLNHFISNSPWDYNELFGLIATYFIKILPSAWMKDLCLAIDESSFPKKGGSSVGVAHQYCGQLGKLSNCQVGVFASLICRDLYCLVFAMLFLPSKWCKKKNEDIAKENSADKSKIDLALEIILKLKSELKIPFKWVCFDSFYGRDTNLLFSLKRHGIKFVADIPKGTRIYLKRPALFLPENKSGRGRKTGKMKVKGRSALVTTVSKSIKKAKFKEVKLRKNRLGKAVKAMFYMCPAFIIEKGNKDIMEVRLLIRKDDDGTIRYSITNDTEKKLERIAYMQGKRYFIERSFQEAKQQFGMNEYQIRGYQGWHRHMAMVSLAMLFLQAEKKEYMENDLIPTTPVLTKIIAKLLPQKVISLNDLLSKIPEYNSNKINRKHGT